MEEEEEEEEGRVEKGGEECRESDGGVSRSKGGRDQREEK